MSYANETIGGWVGAGGARVRVLWRTEGKGGTNEEVFYERKFENAGRFEAVLPDGPLTIHGRLCKLNWYVETRTPGVLREALFYLTRRGAAPIATGAPRNPFSGRYHRTPFLFDSECGTGSMAELFENLARRGNTGVLLGAPGTGKSTLLDAMRRYARELGREMRFVDNGERLGPLEWWRLRGPGLVATAHHPVGLPVLYRTRVSPATAVAVAESILAANPDLPRLVEAGEIAPFLAEAKGNLREALYLLYNVYEDRYSAGSPSSSFFGKASDRPIEAPITPRMIPSESPIGKWPS